MILSNPNNCQGYCSQCKTHHTLGVGESKFHAQHLMGKLDLFKQLDFETLEHEREGALSTAPLFGEERGKMFGVLHCRNRQGDEVILKAFSGQYSGRWSIKNWVPPVFDEALFHHINKPSEKEIKELTKILKKTELIGQQRDIIKSERKTLSQNLMKQLHSIYRLHNFKGQRSSLSTAFYTNGKRKKNIATGTGDCCAPKLLNYANKNNLYPLGISEFYWGRENRSGSKKHGHFYPACKEKCAPILGFILCGKDT